MFNQFVKKCSKEGHKEWEHEDASLELIERIYNHKDMKETFKNLGDLEDSDVTFIKTLIHPPKDFYEQVRHGDDQQKKEHFLYEIVANKTYGVDVDKWDYLARDCLHLGVKNSFDHGRLIASARACVDKDGVSHVTYRDKDIENVYEMFHIRFTLHRKAYQHRINQVLQRMICDAMFYAKDDITVTGEKGTKTNLSDATQHMDAYIKFTDDYVLHQISDSSSTKATELVKRMYTRVLYQFVGEKRIENKTSEDVMNEIVAGNKRMREHLTVEIAKFDYGAKDEDPVDKAYFYMKEDKHNAIHLDKDVYVRRMMIPSHFNEHVARVYCKSIADEDKDKAKELVNAWKNGNNQL